MPHGAANPDYYAVVFTTSKFCFIGFGEVSGGRKGDVPEFSENCSHRPVWTAGMMRAKTSKFLSVLCAWLKGDSYDGLVVARSSNLLNARTVSQFRLSAPGRLTKCINNSKQVDVSHKLRTPGTYKVLIVTSQGNVHQSLVVLQYPNRRTGHVP
jgi:hypothetical protein